MSFLSVTNYLMIVLLNILKGKQWWFYSRPPPQCSGEAGFQWWPLSAASAEALRVWRHGGCIGMTDEGRRAEEQQQEEVAGGDLNLK